ncbi:hypothetical protein MtrunA17_Chr6g0472141 [Medicago truncatula]|uniref:Uncharacterized protein n=1 Tax=Medicago truncatula TaxID=3880 RepID=A0A396HGL9_MEDTR|nr:hypothetical protein MtrunA17_Chr6g0472141 [Medicago truncatula]
MNFIREHFAITGTKIRLEDVPETMYGGALPVAKSRKTKRKALTKEEYLDDAPKQPAKKARRAKKKRVAVQENIVAPAIPTIQEEVEHLEADKILPKRTGNGKLAASSQAAPDQPLIPKKKRRTTIRKLKKKKAEDAVALAKIRELPKGIEVPVSSIAREDAGISAQQVVKATEDVQDLVTSKGGSLLLIDGELEKTTEEVQEGNAGCFEALNSEASRGNPDSPHSTDVINIESSSIFVSLSTTLSSSSTSSDYDDIPLGKIYTTINKGLSPSTKLHKKPVDSSTLSSLFFLRLNCTFGPLSFQKLRL